MHTTINQCRCRGTSLPMSVTRFRSHVRPGTATAVRDGGFWCPVAWKISKLEGTGRPPWCQKGPRWPPHCRAGRVPAEVDSHRTMVDDRALYATINQIS